MLIFFRVLNSKEYKIRLLDIVIVNAPVLIKTVDCKMILGQRGFFLSIYKFAFMFLILLNIAITKVLNAIYTRTK